MSSTSSTMSPPRRSRLLALGLVTGLVAAPLLSAGPATAIKPAGSRAEVILETGDASFDPDNAITAGWWGHEGGVGPAGTGATYLSLNGEDSSGNVNPTSLAALAAAMGTDDIGNIGFAIVPFSADGSQEAPTVSVGESAATAFDWVFDVNAGSALAGSTAANDSVQTVSTGAQLAAWVAAGQPVQEYDTSLVLHDTTPGNPLSTAPKGSSILNTWPAGTHLSLVAYVTDGRDAALNNSIPLVKRGGDGKAMTAWMPFTTVVSPTSSIRTSAGYVADGPAKPTLSLTDSFTGSSGTVTVTVKKPNSSTATDATGKVTYALVTNNVPGSPQDATLTNGVATFPVTIAVGGSQQYEVKYVPAVSEPNYLASDAVRYTVVNEAPPSPTATTTSLTASGTDAYALKATVTPAAAGSVTFSDGSTTLGQATVSGGSATLNGASLSPGQHSLKATFVPASSTAFAGSTGTVTVWVPAVSTTVAPKKVVVGKKPKLTVALDAPGTTATGSVTVTVTPPKGKAKTYTATLQGGKAVIKLAKAVKGKYTLEITYGGSGSVLGVTSSASFKAKPPKKK